jgi:hypothetical protein
MIHIVEGDELVLDHVDTLLSGYHLVKVSFRRKYTFFIVDHFNFNVVAQLKGKDNKWLKKVLVDNGFISTKMGSLRTRDKITNFLNISNVEPKEVSSKFNARYW